MKQWYSWSSIEAFNAWHDPIVADLNLPRIGTNQATGEPEPSKNRTTSYTSVVEVSPNDFRAMVESEIAEQWPNGLGQISTSPPVTEDV